MSAKSSGAKSQGNLWVLSFLDILAILAWGGMLLKYWLTDTLNLLIHPDYFWLV
ncbi:MAG TPA: TIGR03943 family protein, partial [Candidatus Sericytochromatia bacterium]